MGYSLAIGLSGIFQGLKCNPIVRGHQAPPTLARRTKALTATSGQNKIDANVLQKKIGIRLRKVLLYLICSVWLLNAHANSSRFELIADITNADRIEVFSLAPKKSRGVPASTEQCAGSSCFHGWLLLGQTSAIGPNSKQILNNLIGWVRAPVPEALASCFSPRHGARVVVRGHTYDFVLCFECGGGRIYRDDEATPYAYLYSPGHREIWNLMLDSAQVEREHPRAE
jgi:hypothetical protein